jgi:hypothetical protein
MTLTNHATIASLANRLRQRNEQIETQFRRVSIATLFNFKVVRAKGAKNTKYHDSWGRSDVGRDGSKDGEIRTMDSQQTHR